MNKRDIIIQVSQQTGLSQANVHSALESIIQVIKDSISKGEKNYDPPFWNVSDKRI